MDGHLFCAVSLFVIVPSFGSEIAEMSKPRPACSAPPCLHDWRGWVGVHVRAWLGVDVCVCTVCVWVYRGGSCRLWSQMATVLYALARGAAGVVHLSGPSRSVARYGRWRGSAVAAPPPSRP
jgi:hypothetical protein